MIKTISHFLKNIGFNMIADLSNKLVNTVLILLLSHFLGVAAMGSYSVAHTFFSFGLLFSYWGFGNLLTREVARDRASYSKYVSNYGVIRLAFSILAILAINLIAARLDYVEQTQQAIRIISFGILANVIINLINALFIAFEELKYLSAISLTVSVLRLLVSFLVLQFGGSVVTIAIFTTVMEFMSLGISLLFARRFLKGFRFEFNLRFSLSQIMRAFPFFWIAILVILDSRMEILIISLFFNETSVGYYTAMNTIMGGVALFPEGIRNAVFPVFARFQLSAPGRLGEMLLMLSKYILLVTFPVAILIYYLAEPIIFLLFDSGYTLTVQVLQIVIWTFIGYSLTVVAIRLLMVHDLEKRVAFSLLISGGFTVVLDIILAPRMGLPGIALVRLITTYVLLLLCMYFLGQQGYRLIDWGVALRIAGAAGVQFFIVVLLQPVNLYLGLLVGMAAYLGLILLAKVIHKKELDLWVGIFRQMVNRSDSNLTPPQVKQ